MTNMKLKGIVSEDKFGEIIHNAVRSTVNPTTGDVTYWTVKSMFIAKKRGGFYREIHQVHGEYQGEYKQEEHGGESRREEYSRR